MSTHGSSIDLLLQASGDKWVSLHNNESFLSFPFPFSLQSTTTTTLPSYLETGELGIITSAGGGH